MDLNEPTPGPVDEAWVPQTCTLPTAQRPVRVAEFDQLFADSVTGVDTVGPGRIRMRLRPDPATAAQAAGLATRETACCSFFTFTLTATVGDLVLEIAADERHAPVLQALAARAQGRPPAPGSP